MEYLKKCDICGSENILCINKANNICKCRVCGLVFDNPRPTLEEIAGFYSKEDKYDPWLKEERGRNLLWQRRLKMVKSYKKSGSLLDIGAGIGQFLFFARRDFEVFGTEISESAIKIAKEKYNLALIKGALEDIDFGERRFDVITVFHVLEHVPSPSGFIKKCHALLSEDGILVIAVPNDINNALMSLRGIRRPDRLVRKLLSICRDRVMGICRLTKINMANSKGEIHISHFTTKTLKKLLLKNGFALIDDTLDPYYGTTGKAKFYDDLIYYTCLVFKILFNINIYECIWVAARRTELNAE